MGVQPVTQDSKPTPATVCRRFRQALDPNLIGHRQVVVGLVGDESVVAVESYRVEKIRHRGEYVGVATARAAPIDADLTHHESWSRIVEPVWFDEPDEAHAFASSLDDAATVRERFEEAADD